LFAILGVVFGVSSAFGQSWDIHGPFLSVLLYSTVSTFDPTNPRFGGTRGFSRFGRFKRHESHQMQPDEVAKIDCNYQALVSLWMRVWICQFAFALRQFRNAWSERSTTTKKPIPTDVLWSYLQLGFVSTFLIFFLWTYFVTAVTSWAKNRQLSSRNNPERRRAAVAGAFGQV
jgi:hypothetical protein